MAENDPVYKDFYINAGPEAGLKKNLVVTAVRKLNIRDASGATRCWRNLGARRAAQNHRCLRQSFRSRVNSHFCLAMSFRC